MAKDEEPQAAAAPAAPAEPAKPLTRAEADFQSNSGERPADGLAQADFESESGEHPFNVRPS